MKAVIGRFLLQQRERSRLTRPQLAKITKVSVNTIRNYELGVYDISFEYAVMCADACNFKINELAIVLRSGLHKREKEIHTNRLLVKNIKVSPWK